MENQKNLEAKERIIKSAASLFSKKGFDGTSVSEIAASAEVTKALIYYYFKGKEDILDAILESILDDFTNITMDFVHTSIVQMIKDHRLDIKPDRLSFATEADINCFIENAHLFFENLLMYVLKYRHVLRILILESLKSGKHREKLFHLIDLSSNNIISKTILEADQDFVYSDDMKLFEFFFSIFPLLSFAAYFDDYKTFSGLDEEKLKKSFLQSLEVIVQSLISGREIFLQNKNELH